MAVVLTKSTLLKFYKRKDIQEALISHAKDKEIGIRYNDSFGCRPDALTYPRDVLESALKNATSFHASEELWSNPLALSSSSSRKEHDSLRIGWDLVLDVDCALLEYSKICADLIIKFLEYCRVQSFGVKFSGNKGFHIGIPFEAFPQKVGNVLTKDLFPEAPRKIAAYIKENIKDALGERILAFEKNNFSVIQKKVNLPQEEIIRHEATKDGDIIAKLNVDKFLEIDTVLLSSRHLYRMPYSLHEKSGLASIPIDPSLITQFEKSMAVPEHIAVSRFVFLDRNVVPENARRLLMQALDFKIETEEGEERKYGPQKTASVYEEMHLESPVKEELFPPCMKLILQGLVDGKKRGMFCLINFLGKIGWNKQEIEQLLIKWNREKNPEPLREVVLKGQLNHFSPGERLPPNCHNDAYYLNIGICKPDGLCARIKNPVNYTIVRWKRHLQDKRQQNKEEQQGREEKIRKEEKN